MIEKVKFLCWDDDEQDEEEGEVIEGYPLGHQQIAETYAEKLYDKAGPDWNAKCTTIMVKNMTTNKRYKFEVSTEYEPVFYTYLREEMP